MKSSHKIKLNSGLRLFLIIGLILLSVTFVQAAEIEGRWGTGEYVDVYVSGSIAACAALGAGVDIFDISDPAHPVLRANFDTSYNCLGVCINGNRIYAADANAGLHIIDISNLAAPSLLGSYDTQGAQDVLLVGNIAYVANQAMGLYLIDISNPEAPVLSGTFATEIDAERLFISGSTAYIVDVQTGLEIIDISDPLHPRHLTTRLNKDATGIKVTNNIACFSIGWNGVELLDVSNPAAPQLLATIKNGNSYLTKDAFITGKRLFAATTGSGLQIFNITDPAAPALSGSIAINGTPRDLVLAGTTALIACESGGLALFNIAEGVEATEVGRYDHSGEALSVSAAGQTAYLAEDEGNLQIIDISNPQTPTRIGHFDNSAGAQQVQVINGRAYIGANYKFMIVDVGNPAQAVEIGSCSLPDQYCKAIQVDGNRVYIANFSAGLLIIDISDPASPTIIGNYQPGNSIYVFGVQVVGTTAYVGCYSSGLHIVDISNPASPSLIGSYDTPWYAGEVRVAGSTAYVADSFGGLQIINISDPKHPSLRKELKLPRTVDHIQLAGNRVYVTVNGDSTDSIQIIDISDPNQAEVIETIETTGAPAGIYVLNNKAYVAEGSSGRLLIINLGADNHSNIYFPHAACGDGWSTEVALINTGAIEAGGDLRAYDNLGNQIGRAKDITLKARGRWSVGVNYSFYDADIKADKISYLIFRTGSKTIVGYTRFANSQLGYQVALPVNKDDNATFNVSHIASDDNWWTGIALLNTTDATKTLPITFSDGQTKSITLVAHEHKSLSIRNLFNDTAQPRINAAVIAACSGIVGFELFGSIGDIRQLSGISLSDKTENTIYYPHISSTDGWWTGLAAFDPAGVNRALTITPYAKDGRELTKLTVNLAEGIKKYLNSAGAMGLPAGTAWIQIDAASGVTGFELFGNNGNNWLAGYTGVGLKSKKGIFATLEQDSGWTGIALVNSEAENATVILRARDNLGKLIARKDLPLRPHERLMGVVETIFAGDDLSKAHYLSYESNRELVGFQINGSDRLLDALPALKY